MLEQNDLQYYLQLGDSVVDELWNYRAKDWVICVHAADIDNDGKNEILAGSRDGRLRSLTVQGDCIWERVIGEKMSVTAVDGINQPDTIYAGAARVLVGTQDGRLYALDEDGRTIGQDGATAYLPERNNRSEEREAYWHNYERTINFLYLNLALSPQIIVDLEGRDIHSFDYQNRTPKWTFKTTNWAQSVFAGDLNKDGQLETIISSGDRHLDIINQDGEPVQQKDFSGQIHPIFASDLDKDGETEIMLVIDGKHLHFLDMNLEEKYPVLSFKSRIRAFRTADLDNDGYDEIIIACENKMLFVFDYERHLLWKRDLGYRALSLYTSDFDNDGQTEILLGAEDARIHALRIKPIRGLYEKIQETYLQTDKALLNDLFPPSSIYYGRLQDIIGEEKHATPVIKAQDIEQWYRTKDYKKALSIALQLEQQKIQVLEQLSLPEEEGHILAMGIGNVCQNEDAEIIIGTDKGQLSAFNTRLTPVWKRSLQGQIFDIQTGYIKTGKWAQIQALTSDQHLHILSVNTGTNKTPVPHLQMPGDQRKTSGNITGFYIYSPGKNKPFELIVGNENNCVEVYRNDLEKPALHFQTPHSIARIYTYYQPGKYQGPGIIIGDNEKNIYAYTREGELLWTYLMHEKINALLIKDIDNDDNPEVIVGSDDLNLYVIDHLGRLKWRYYLKEPIKTMDVADIDGNERHEILVGDRYGGLYVFNNKGDLLWTYRNNKKIVHIHARKIDDEDVKIIVGMENQIEILQWVNQDELRYWIDQNWQALLNQARLQQKTQQEAVRSLLYDANAVLRAFALRKLEEAPVLSSEDFHQLESVVRDPSSEVRQALIPTIMEHYNVNSPRAKALLSRLSKDPDRNVKLAFIQNIRILMRNDYQESVNYLHQFFKNMDKLGRRNLLRILYNLVSENVNEQLDHEIFSILQKSAVRPQGNEENSEWIKQESARVLARFFDNNQVALFSHLNRLIIRGIEPHILKDIGYHASIPRVQRVVEALALLVGDFSDQDAQTHLKGLTQMIKENQQIHYGEEMLLIYSELQRLFEMRTLDEIAQYRTTEQIKEMEIETETYFHYILHLFSQISTIVNILNRYLKRKGTNDKAAALLEANIALEKLKREVLRAYPQSEEEDYTLLPDYQLFELLIARWSTLITREHNQLIGKPKLKAELQSSDLKQEEQIAICLVVYNEGSSSAQQINVKLLDSPEFEQTSMHEDFIEILFNQEERICEFTLKPHGPKKLLTLDFEISYNDSENQLLIEEVQQQIHLVEAAKSPDYLPNPYTTGTPLQNSEMLFGREKELEFLQERLGNTAAKTMIILYGQRKSGKTTLLKHLVNTSILEKHVPVFIDMQSVTYVSSDGGFFYNVARQIQTNMRKRGYTLPPPQLKTFEENPTEQFNELLDAVEEQLKRQNLILLIDEFEALEEQIARKKLSGEIYSYLRSLFQHRPYLNILLAGTHKLDELTIDYRSVFFNQAQQYRLQRLSERAAEELISKPLAGRLEYEGNAIRKIHRLTSGQPYLIHLFCHELVHHCNEHKKNFVTLHDVNSVQQNVVNNGRGHFEWILKRLVPEDRIALAILAEGQRDDGQGLALLEIEQLYQQYHVTYELEKLLGSLQTLIDAEFIERLQREDTNHLAERQRYLIPVGLIRLWLKQERPLELVLRQELHK